jgi:FkbM family methyltransferase
VLPDPEFFSPAALLRAARELRRAQLPRSMKFRILWAYFRLLFLGCPRRAFGTTGIAGFKVSYPSLPSLRYLFREIFLRQEYQFTTATPKPFIIDCGANIGLAALYFKALYPAAELLAFEPDPDAFVCLSSNVAQNGLGGIALRNAALAGEDGEIVLYASSSGPGGLNVSVHKARSGGEPRRVTACKLSTFITRPVDLLKMDIEGAESEVLAELRSSGKLPLVSRIVLEYHHHISAASDALSGLLEILESSGFGYQLSGSLARPLRPGGFQDILIYAYRKK